MKLNGARPRPRPQSHTPSATVVLLTLLTKPTAQLRPSGKGERQATPGLVKPDIGFEPPFCEMIRSVSNLGLGVNGWNIGNILGKRAERASAQENVALARKKGARVRGTKFSGDIVSCQCPFSGPPP